MRWTRQERSVVWLSKAQEDVGPGTPAIVVHSVINVAAGKHHHATHVAPPRLFDLRNPLQDDVSGDTGQMKTTGCEATLVSSDYDYAH